MCKYAVVWYKEKPSSNALNVNKNITAKMRQPKLIIIISVLKYGNCKFFPKSFLDIQCFYLKISSLTCYLVVMQLKSSPTVLVVTYFIGYTPTNKWYKKVWN